MIASTETTARGALDSAHPQRAWWRSGQRVLVWCLFFLICFGLGYPTLNRYQPRTLEGLSDSAVYYQLVRGADTDRPRNNIFAGRILVPYLAKPFYRAARPVLRTWDPVYFGLLVANSILCATTSLALVSAGLVVTKDAGIALLGAMLYLLNFAVPNLQLAGMIDSGEACFMMLLAWALLLDKWWLLPLLGIGGALAKETFVPFAAFFSIAWWLTAARKDSLGPRKLGWVIGMIILGCITTSVVQFALTGQLLGPWNIAAAMDSQTNYLRSFFRCIAGKGFWSVFIWLLPLGLWRWRQLPRPWLMAALLTAGVALLFGTYSNMAGTVARPIFNVAGPLLALSAGIFLSRALDATNSLRVD